MEAERSKAFRDQPFALIEDESEEQERIQRLRRDDPISLQDALNTSRALVDAVKAGDMEELQSIVANAEEGEFLQVFVVQAFVLALKSGSLPLVKEMVHWGMPLSNLQLSQALHLVCEITNRDNFSDTWRILQLLTDGNSDGKLNINAPRIVDGWTPLCIACADACLPLAFKLLELDADPNVITRSNATPLSIVKIKRPDDTEEQQEARGIIANMLRHYGGEADYRKALQKAKMPRKDLVQAEEVTETADGYSLTKQVVSKSHTRFSA
jgi:hypothetical protein